MASLKSIRERINSVKTTQKITSAMKMISSAKLHRASKVISNTLPYSDALQRLLTNLFAAEGDFSTPLTQKRPVKKTAIVAFSSDSSLAGAFNTNVARELRDTIKDSGLKMDDVYLFTVGKKIYEFSKKYGYPVQENFADLAAKPDYERIADLADRLTQMFVSGEIDRVELVYHHFKSSGSQVLTREDFLPLTLPSEEEAKQLSSTDYIFEPARNAILETLLPQSLRFKLYAVLLDSNASEHAARMIAMQIATDNADNLLADLTLTYNKLRQQAITNQILDLVGGQMK